MKVKEAYEDARLAHSERAMKRLMKAAAQRSEAPPSPEARLMARLGGGVNPMVAAQGTAARRVAALAKFSQAA